MSWNLAPTNSLKGIYGNLNRLLYYLIIWKSSSALNLKAFVLTVITISNLQLY